ncbi:HEAT repeat domain-containing protein [Nocardia sp. bgisy134]|uniref:HEAT repeat domain-containing protein n=1 Tax=Nocardia sp. bgisy134 TaxID=3413789 RepID=UPI003D73D4EB
MSAELDDVDWESVDVRYGSDTGIPELLREVASGDDFERTEALRELEDQLHPDGKVYDDDYGYQYDYDHDFERSPVDESRAARLAALCTPFLLELAARPFGPDRLRMLRLIAALALVGEDEDEDEEQPFRLWSDTELSASVALRNRQEVRRAIGRALRELLDLLDDTDADIRVAVVRVLTVCEEQWATVVPALQARLGFEPDSKIRVAMIGVIGAIALYRPEQAARLGIPQWFAELLCASEDPIDHLTALDHLLAADPQALPGRVVPIVMGAAHRILEPSGDHAETLHTRRDVWPIRTVYTRMASRPEEQFDLVRGLIGSELPTARGFACELAEDLIRTWRTDHVELLEAITDQLADSGTWFAAAQVLARLGTAAAPVIDRILEQLERYERVTEWHGQATRFPQPLELPWLSLHTELPMLNQPGPLLRAAANTGDARAVPAVRWALELDETPDRLEEILAPLGTHAIELVPLIRDRMVHTHTHPADPYLDMRAYRLARALGAIGEPAAAAAPDIAGMLSDRKAELVEVLGQLGVGARSTVETVRRFLDHDRPRVRLDAAVALWRFTGDPEPALAQLHAVLADDDDAVRAVKLRAHAIEVAGTLGFAAGDCAPALRRLIDLDTDRWATTAAAIALWRVTADPEPTLTLLLDLSAGEPADPDTSGTEPRPHWLTVAAECFAEIGPAARAAAPLLAAELARPRRRPGSVPADIELCHACRRALDAIFAA